MGAGGVAYIFERSVRGPPWIQSGKWKVQIKVNGKIVHIGYYDDEEEAAGAYDVRARKLGRPTNFD